MHSRLHLIRCPDQGKINPANVMNPPRSAARVPAPRRSPSLPTCSGCPLAAWLVAALVCLSPVRLPGGVPTGMAYQGYLTGTGGTAIADGNHNVDFTIYEKSKDGTAIWRETQTVTFKDGYFSVVLGTGTHTGMAELFADVFKQQSSISSDDGSRYLGIKVQGIGSDNTELSPRLQLLTSPYAFTAQRALGLTSSDGTDVATVTSSGITMAGMLTATTLSGALSGANLTSKSVPTGALADGAVTAAKLDGGATDANTGNALVKRDATGGFQAGTITLAGKLGIGTSAPSSPLTVDSTGYGIVQQSGTVKAGFWISSGGGDDRANVGTISSHRLGFETGGTTRMTLTTDGKLGIGTTSPTHPLTISGAVAASFTLEAYLDTGGAANASETRSDLSHSIWASGRMNATAYDVRSDARNKRIINRLEGQAALEQVMHVQVTEYLPLDVPVRDRKSRRGFIAQEVDAVMPGSVTLAPEFVADISSLSETVTFDAAAQTLSVRMSDPHNLKVGDLVRILTDAGAVERKVSTVPDAIRFVVGDWSDPVERVFVYGRKVEDFHTLDYDRVYTTGIAAIQELARRNEELEKKVAHLETLERQVAELQKLVRQLAANQGGPRQAQTPVTKPAAQLVINR